MSSHALTVKPDLRQPEKILCVVEMGLCISILHYHSFVSDDYFCMEAKDKL